MKMLGGPPLINARTKINPVSEQEGGGRYARETRRPPIYFARFFFLVKAGTNDGRHINGEFRCEGGILSPIVRLGASWLETCTSIRLRNNRRLNVACVVEMFVQIGRRKRRGGGCWNNSFLRFLGGGVVHHVSTTWKKIDRPINRNRATPPPLFYRIIERMSQRSLTPPPSPSDLPYSRFRSEIIRNRERERQRDEEEEDDEA